jgi:hypothetical protein
MAQIFSIPPQLWKVGNFKEVGSFVKLKLLIKIVDYD